MRVITLDTEFLDPRPGGVLLTIGAVVINLDTGKLGDEFYVKIDPDLSVKAGMTIMPSTLMWWMEQPAAAREEAFSGKEDLTIAITKLGHFIRQARKQNEQQNGVDHIDVYSCGKEDIVLIEAAARISNKWGTTIPWKYNEPKDYRTIRDLMEGIVAPPDPEGIAHNALDDARWQAKYLLRMIQKMSDGLLPEKIKAKPVTTEEEL